MRLYLYVCLALIIVVPQAQAESVPCLNKIENAYAFATSKTQKNGAVFLTVSGCTGDKLVKASTDIAERVELHTHAMDGDMMMMREVEYLDVPAAGDGVLQLKPMGDHIMLLGLQEQLKEGNTFPLALFFEYGAEYGVSVQVVKPGMLPNSSVNHELDHGHSHDH